MKENHEEGVHYTRRAVGSNGRTHVQYRAGAAVSREADTLDPAVCAGRRHRLHVPYNGGGPAERAVLTGEVSFYFGSGPTVSPHVSAGKLNAIASTGLKRSKTFPGIQTPLS